MSLSNRKTLILPASDIEHIMTEIGLDKIMDQLIVSMTKAFIDFDPEKIIIPIRSGFNYTEPEIGLIEWMPLYHKGGQVVVKMVGYHPDNPNKYNLPTILSNISNYDTTTGHLKSVVDGVFLTALRTGAASAIASKSLAHPDSSILGLIGCGAQSVTQLHGLSRIFDIKEVLYFDADFETNESFIARVSMLNIDITFTAMSIEEICEKSDIICTATSIDVGEGPLFHHVSTKEHLHINAVGSDFPGKIELPLEYLKNSFVCPDFIAQALKEGECQQLKREDIGADLFECIQQPQKHEKLRNQRTVFDSTGLPLEDSVVLDLFLGYAIQMKLGLEIELENISSDVKSPYQFMKIKESVKTNKR
ncbi:MAG: ornithine cyclodeaminase/alanine dehydrogenase-like protein (mu-crystallin family) [Maribacter sp.]|jgi:ornithine cyclodeaminase/alanine dehydrogenase-like protein (mu-crystallin family)